MAKIIRVNVENLKLGDVLEFKDNDKITESFPIKYICRNMYFFGEGRSISLETIKIRIANDSLNINKEEV